MELVIFLILIWRTVSIDIGCNEHQPRRCPNGKIYERRIICKTELSECEGFEGCVNTEFPYLCSNGRCARNFYECSEKYYICEDSTKTKCVDGICRDDCVGLRHSSCVFDNPIRCPDGRCVDSEVDCVSLKCPPDEPFIGALNICKTSFSLLEYPFNIRILKNEHHKLSRDLKIFLSDQENTILATVSTPHDIDLNIRGVALSEISNS